ncbi:hypothetical protein PAPYR_5483 [Paratrimastix pyriformis]|uniref:Sugar phosphate phosphatase n=1 Tax=Paratrimastix pyriformis TaxID=342808 RepID=A0ABQ8ULZ7_9EUKA|nr:hypothetical protein PAPYR_5483 [Paratrimastix pyriformis]
MPFPEPITTHDAPGTFIHRTMNIRIPQILRNVIQAHRLIFPSAMLEELNSLLNEMTTSVPIQFLTGTCPPPDPQWNLDPWQTRFDTLIPSGRGWRDHLPWYFVEVLFYRRVLSITNFYGERRGVSPAIDRFLHYDPFSPSKQAELASESSLCLLMNTLAWAAQVDIPFGEQLAGLLNRDLWGNQADLSFSGGLNTSSAAASSHASRKDMILVDDTEVITGHMCGLAWPGRVDFICDNVGAELLMDLVLAVCLLRRCPAGLVRLHVKDAPLFVSDTTPADVRATLAYLRRMANDPTGDFPRFAALHREHPGLLADFVGFLEERVVLPLDDHGPAPTECSRAPGRIHICPHPFWNGPAFFHEPQAMPAHLRALFGASSDAVLVKGDANYRRLVGDSRLWDPETPAGPVFSASFPREEVTGAVRAPLLVAALRTLKSEPIVGLPPGLATKLDASPAETDWRSNGKHGIIQAVMLN